MPAQVPAINVSQFVGQAQESLTGVQFTIHDQFPADVLAFTPGPALVSMILQRPVTWGRGLPCRDHNTQGLGSFHGLIPIGTRPRAGGQQRRAFDLGQRPPAGIRFVEQELDRAERGQDNDRRRAVIYRAFQAQPLHRRCQQRGRRPLGVNERGIEDRIAAKASEKCQKRFQFMG